MKNIILKVLLLNLCFFFNAYADFSIYTVKDNQVFLQNDQNVLKLREKAKKLAFDNAFNILVKKILEPSEIRKLERFEKIDISSLIKDFKIVEEKITDINYSANILVNFNPDQVLNFFDSSKIKSKVLVSEEYLVLPIFKKFNTFYLWENDNIWYDYLLDEYDELGLLKLYFPKKNHINKIQISPKQILNQDNESIKNFLIKKKKKKALIIFLEENYNLKINKINSTVSAALFSDKGFETIKLFKNDVYEENSNLSNAKLLSKIIIKELDEWWKKKIDSPDFESSNENVFFIELQTNNLKDNILIEKRINEILGKKGFILHEFNNREIIYKVITRYDLEQLNLALETDNLRLEKSTKKENLFRLKTY